MGRLSIEDRLRIVTLASKGYSFSSIRRRLIEENISISVQALYNLMAKFREKGTIVDLPRRSKHRKITESMKTLIEEEMNKNDELTARGIRRLLSQRWPELQVSIPTIKRVRQEMGWVCTRPHYCQLLRNVRILNLIFSHKYSSVKMYWHYVTKE